jgi:hypothetical protein
VLNFETPERQDGPASTSSSRLALEPNPARAASREFHHGLLVGGLSAVGAALYSVGVPKDSILQYEVALKANKFILVAHGSTNEIARAREIIDTTNPTEVNVHGGGALETAGAPR